jgi:multidrug transporter EmrE-like cation transporter
MRSLECSVKGGKGLIVYALIMSTIILTVGGQLLLKSAMQEIGSIPTQVGEIVPFVLKVYQNWKVVGGLVLAVLASFTWMGAVSRSDISFAYPFMGLAIVLVLAVSPMLFEEEVSFTRWLGVIVVCIGLWIAAQS